MTVSASYLSLPDPATMAVDLAERLPEFGHVAWVSETGSTNADLLARVRAGGYGDTPMPWLLGTHLQRGGRGRAGRPWQNDAGACLMLSCAFHVQISGHKLPALSPLAGLAACEALKSLVDESAAADILVKWPNDVQFGAKKLGGILVETARPPECQGYVVVIGMGLNLTNGAALSETLNREIADWSQVLGAVKSIKINWPVQLANALARHWADIVEQVDQQGFAGFRDRYRQIDALAGKLVNVIDQGSVLFTGRAIGYDEFGRLEVETTERGVVPVSVGDVSVRLTP